MAYIIAVAGKGGVGKTTVTALLIKYLIKKSAPVLAVDADPNSNLNVLLGLDYRETIADIREEAKNLNSASLSKSDYFNMRLQEILVESKGFDLLVMGRPEGPGCYCAVNNILREFLSRLSKNYKYVIIDNEAGMEHLSRRTSDNVDKLFLVSDETSIAIRSAINAYDTAKKAGLKVRDAGIIINKSKKPLGDEQLKPIRNSVLKIAGYVRYSEKIEKDSESGKVIDEDLGSLLSVDLSSILEVSNGKLD